MATAAGEVLTKEKAVTAVDVCVGTGWLSASHVEQDTDYDDLLMAGVPRAEARDQIRAAIDRLLAIWSLPQPEPAVPGASSSASASGVPRPPRSQAAPPQPARCQRTGDRDAPENNLEVSAAVRSHHASLL